MVGAHHLSSLFHHLGSRGRSRLRIVWGAHVDAVDAPHEKPRQSTHASCGGVQYTGCSSVLLLCRVASRARDTYSSSLFRVDDIHAVRRTSRNWRTPFVIDCDHVVYARAHAHTHYVSLFLSLSLLTHIPSQSSRFSVPCSLFPPLFP